MTSRESVAATTKFAVEYVHLHLLLHWLVVRDHQVLLVEFLLGDRFAQARDALGCLGLHGFIASGELIHMFALSVLKIILLISCCLL